MQWFSSFLYVAQCSVVQEPALARAVSLAENNQANMAMIDIVSDITSGLSNSPGGPVAGEGLHVGHFWMQIMALSGSVLGANQHTVIVAINAQLLRRSQL
jgi:hypothetical protein